MQRGLVMIFAAAANKARDRAARSAIPENELGGRRSSRSWANAETNATQPVIAAVQMDIRNAAKTCRLAILLLRNRYRQANVRPDR